MSSGTGNFQRRSTKKNLKFVSVFFGILLNSSLLNKSKKIIFLKNFETKN